MEFPFPLIRDLCPVCEKPCCAIYRGYYRRWVICPTLLFIGWIAIRTGFCKHKGRRFALFPEFLIPFRAFSRDGFLRLWRAWLEKPGDLANTVDEWFHELSQEVSFSVSTLQSQLRLILRQVRAGSGPLGMPACQLVRVSALCSLPSGSVDQAIRHRAFGVWASLRIDPPP